MAPTLLVWCSGTDGRVRERERGMVSFELGGQSSNRAAGQRSQAALLPSSSIIRPWPPWPPSSPPPTHRPASRRRAAPRHHTYLHYPIHVAGSSLAGWLAWRALVAPRAPQVWWWWCSLASLAGTWAGPARPSQAGRQQGRADRPGPGPTTPPHVVAAAGVLAPQAAPCSRGCPSLAPGMPLSPLLGPSARTRSGSSLRSHHPLVPRRPTLSSLTRSRGARSPGQQPASPHLGQQQMMMMIMMMMQVPGTLGSARRPCWLHTWALVRCSPLIGCLPSWLTAL